MIKANFYSGLSSNREEIELRVETAALILIFRDRQVAIPKKDLLINAHAEGYIRIDFRNGSSEHLSIGDPDSFAEFKSGMESERIGPIPRSFPVLAYGLGFLVLCVGGVLLAPVFGRVIGTWIPDSFGRLLAAPLMKEFRSGACTDPELLKPIQFYSEWLLPPEMKIEMVVSSAGAVNAYALPGMMVLNFGLIRESESPEEVIGIMAHEAGHLHHRHFGQGLVGRVFLSGLAMSLKSVSEWVPFALFNHHTSELESVADEFALVRLNALGLSGSPMVGFFKRQMEKAPAHPAASVLESIFSDHPLSSERMLRFSETDTEREREIPSALQSRLFEDRKNWKEIRTRCFEKKNHQMKGGSP